MKKILTIKPSNYNTLKFVTGNRPVNPKVVARMVTALESGSQFAPAVGHKVGAVVEIYDGQHRVMAHMELGLDIPIVDLGEECSLENIVAMQQQAKWKPSDYIHSFCVLGYRPYKILRRLMDETGLPHSIILHAILGQEDIREFKAGNLALTERMAADAAVTLRRLKELRDICPKLVTKRLAGAVTKLVTARNYNHKYMLDRLANNYSLVKSVNSAADGLEMVEHLYNYNKKTKLVDLTA